VSVSSTSCVKYYISNIIIIIIGLLLITITDRLQRLSAVVTSNHEMCQMMQSCLNWQWHYKSMTVAPTCPSTSPTDTATTHSLTQHCTSVDFTIVADHPFRSETTAVLSPRANSFLRVGHRTDVDEIADWTSSCSTLLFSTNGLAEYGLRVKIIRESSTESGISEIRISYVFNQFFIWIYLNIRVSFHISC